MEKIKIQNKPIKMPQAFIGETFKQNPYAYTKSRRWTEEEKKYCLAMSEAGYSHKDIAYATGRSEVSVSLKMKRMKKTPEIRTYNKEHITDKYTINIFMAEYLQPNTILDIACGTENFWKNNIRKIGATEVYTNDLNSKIQADAHMPADKEIARLYSLNKTFDIIDIDLFGSPYDCIDLAIRMSNKGLFLTLGEMGHKRFKRLDFVRDHYNITTMEQFTSDNIIKEIIRMGACHKKKLTPVYVMDCKNISRVWFSVSKLKKTEQWHI